MGTNVRSPAASSQAIMTLSIPTSLPPMEALLVADLPQGPEWQYEPKWAGFRWDDAFFLAAGFLLDEAFFLLDDDFFGTFPPAFLASDNPIAIACLRLLTFFPERPLLRVPALRSCIAFLTLLCAFLPYLAILHLLRRLLICRCVC
jgi:hypothetical protein